MNYQKSTTIRQVCAGDMVAISSRNERLEAYLASCIGVTLCDRKAKVGGLIHLLLPESTGEGTPWNPLAYAKTGIPLFIQALCEQGASIENMEACVSGGALVGPVNDLDINLDIGGRTAEVVHSILRSEGIRVVQSETGGCFCCKLSLDLMTFEASINPVTDMPGQDDEEKFQKPDSDSIADSIQGVRPIPQIALKIARMTENDDYDISGIAKEIRQDQVLSAKIIALSNSSFMGQTKKVDSIERALIISGEKMLFQMVLSASLELYFHDVLRGYSLCKGALFKHALGSAMVCEKLAQLTGKAQPAVAYTAGLLHDIGKVVLDQYIARAAPFFYRRTQVDMVDICDAEKEKIGTTHMEVGAILAENWSLPENITDTIRFHHCPESAKSTELTHLVYLADLLMNRFQIREGLQSLNRGNFTSRLKRLGLSAAGLSKVVELMSEKSFNYSLQSAPGA